MFEQKVDKQPRARARGEGTGGAETGTGTGDPVRIVVSHARKRLPFSANSPANA